MKARTASSCETTIKVFLVDDHAVVRQGTRELLSGFANLQVVGEAASGEGVLEQVTEHAPDVLLLDIQLPGKKGLTLLSELKATFPQLAVILFSAHTDLPYVQQALQQQANGYLSKTVDHWELKQAIERAHQQQGPVFSNDIQAALYEHKTAAETPLMTPREQEILMHVAKGHTNSGIAKTLHVSVKTVDSHVASLIKKLGVKNRSQLTAYAYHQGLL